MIYFIASVLVCAASLSTATAVPRHKLELRQIQSNNSYANWPTYNQLPLDPSYPTRAAWGVWGDDDVHGALNHITQETILEAASEIQTGQAFNLNLELQFIPRPILARRKPTVHLIQPGPQSNDDVVTLNTQASTQFDGLRHYMYSDPVEDRVSTYRWYNNLIPNYEDVIGGNRTDVLGIQQAAEKGIAARGVLLDYKAWMDSKNEVFDPLTAYSIPVSDLDQVAEWQGLSGNWSKPGDILIVRFGWIEAFAQLNDTERQALVLGPGEYIGVPPNDQTAEWLWNKKLAMVGGDNSAFEISSINPVPWDGQLRNLHMIMIAGWGQSIMEFIDTEKIAPALRAVGRSTFFMTIQTLNVRGGIASPPNAMGII